MSKSAPLPVRHLAVTDLTCLRGGTTIFANLGFSAEPGTVTLLRGPNGAGKTSLLLCLAGILRPEAGTIAWSGRDAEERPSTDMHLVGHQPALKGGLTAAENLQFWAEINSGDPNLIEGALDNAGLSHAAHLETRLLSAGQTRRLALARLLVARRPVWLLDEPTAALDSQGDKWVASLIEEQIGAGGLVIAATHLDLALKKSRSVRTLKLGPGK